VGGVRVAIGDVNGDGTPDIITAPGQDGGPDIRIWDVTTNGTTMIGEFNAYSPFFQGGVFVAAGDVNGDGKAEIITGPDTGGGPDVRVFNLSGALLQEFAPYSQSFTGGVRVAAGDLIGAGHADIITASGPGMPALVEAFDGTTLKMIQSQAPYGPFFLGGAYVAAGDFNSDGRADIIVGAGFGGGPNVLVFSGPNGAMLANFNAGPTTETQGVRVGVVHFNSSPTADILTSFGMGAAPQVEIYGPSDLTTPMDAFFAYNQFFLGGVYVGGV
jgi:hypothetical protein